MRESYENYIENILNTRGRNGCGESYYETHHIIPKCLGGTNAESNLIDLYAYEHFMAHKLLAEQHPEVMQLVNAYAMMAFGKSKNHQRVELTAEEYDHVRKIFSDNMKKRWKDADYRSAQLDMMRLRWKNQEYRKCQSENRTRLNYEMWKDVDFKAKMIQKSKDRWKYMNSDELQKRKDAMRTISNQLWKDQIYIKHHCTPVFCIETQEYFLCQQDAVQKYGVSASGLSSNLSGKQKSAGKHPITKLPLHWKKVTWEECRDHISQVCHSEKINLLNSSDV